MPAWRSLCGFLRECYEADNREGGVANLLAEEVRHLYLPGLGADVLTGALDRVPMELAAAEALRRDAGLFATEKSVVVGFFFLLGTSRDRHRSHLAAPLLLAPGVVEVTPTAGSVRVDLAEARLNARVLARLVGENADGALSSLAERLPPLPVGPATLPAFTQALGAAFGDLDISALAGYPRAADEAELRTAATSRVHRVRLVPGVAVALVPTSPDTRHVLAELGELAGAVELSPPLRTLAGERVRPAGEPVDVPLPASLSPRQRAILASAATRPLTVAVGPPGTGKSFTVAALALAHAAAGRSVLVATRQEQALTVVADKLADLAGGLVPVLRGGRGEVARRLRESLDALLAGGGGEAPPAAELRSLRREVAARARALVASRRGLAAALARERAWSACRVGGAVPLLRRPRAAWLEWRLHSHPPLWAQSARCLAAEEEVRAGAAAHLRALLAFRLAEALARRRPHLVALSRGLRARTRARLCEQFAGLDRGAVLGAFPIWLTTIADVGELVPLEPALFDLAIVDEATQCDLASCLPVLQRARRAVVTGDPRQLRHVSFLSDERLGQAAVRHGLDERAVETFHYRRRSLLDLMLEAAGGQDQVVALDEHFRSRPPIIAFSNREIYGGGLAVMTARPATERAECLRLVRVEGRRDGRGVNREEAAALVDEVVRLVEGERALPDAVCHSLGVLSPFREQVDHLARLLAGRLDAATVARHRLLVGTAHGFQGEERDVMLLSLAVDPGSVSGVLRFVERPDVFNVSVTRARQLQVVFSSIPPGLAGAGLLGRYLAHLEASRTAPLPAASGRDTFLDEVREELAARGFQVWPRYRVAGREIDLVAERGGATVGIDLVGPPGPVGAALGWDDTGSLARAGLRLVPLPLSAWRRDRASCLAAVEAVSRAG